MLLLKRLLTTFWGKLSIESILLGKKNQFVYCAFSSLRKYGKKGKNFSVPLLLKSALGHLIVDFFCRLNYVLCGIRII